MGEICSGKSRFQKSLDSSVIQIETGQLVREKYNTIERIFDNSLDNYLLDTIYEIIKKNPDADTFCIAGVRQISLLKMLAGLFDDIELNYLVCPRYILRKRYYKRADGKDSKISFEDAIAGDESLGMSELKMFLLTHTECNFIKTY